MRNNPLLVGCVLIVLIGCGGSRDKLLADLQSPRAHERALAVKKLAEHGNPDDLVLFTRAAKDVTAIVRGEAAEALGKSQDPRVVDILGELLEDSDEDVQAKAAMALAQIKNDKAKAYLTIQYARRGRSTRFAIVQALKAANVPGAMAQVVAAEGQAIWERNLRALKDGALPERVAAAEELGKSGRAEAVNRLLPLTRDSHVILAAAAVRGLGYAGDRRAVEPITHLLSEKFPELREAACEALQLLQDPQALPTLKAVALEKSSASAPATAAIIALPHGDDTQAALCEIAGSSAEPEALVAAREMRERGGCPLDSLLERLARQRDPASALNAVRGLGPTAVAAAPRVIPYLSSNDSALRDRALAAAMEIGDPSAAPAVQKIYDQELARIQELRADWVSGTLPNAPEEAAPPPQEPITPAQEAALKHQELFRRVEQANQARAEQAGKLRIKARPPAEIVDDASDDQLQTFASAIRALGMVRAPGALQTVGKHVADPSAVVRAAAYAAMAYLGDEGIQLAAAGLVDSEREVQASTARALAEQGKAGQQKIAELLPKLPGERIVLLEPLTRVRPQLDSFEPLETVIREGGPDAALAAQVVGAAGANGVEDTLATALKDPNAVARRDLLLALGATGGTGAADVIAKDLYHDSPDVRAAAARALAKLGAEQHHEPLDALKGDYYRAVRDSAEAALSRLAPAVAEPSK